VEVACYSVGSPSPENLDDVPDRLLKERDGLGALDVSQVLGEVATVHLEEG